MEEHRVSLGGLDFVYDHRRGSGTPFLFLHGGTASAATFDDVLDGVPVERPIFNFDQRGHGRTAWSTSKDYHVENFVDDARLMLAEVTGPAIIVGWSMGGLAGLFASALDPHMVKGLLMADASPYVGETTERWTSLPVSPFVMGLSETLRELPNHDLEWAIERVGELEAGGIKMRDIMSPEMLRSYVTEALPMDPDVVPGLFSRTITYDIDRLITQIACPVRFVQGNPQLGGTSQPGDIDRLQNNISDFDCRHEERVGHGVHRRPVHNEFAADIRALGELVP